MFTARFRTVNHATLQKSMGPDPTKSIAIHPRCSEIEITVDQLDSSSYPLKGYVCNLTALDPTMSKLTRILHVDDDLDILAIAEMALVGLENLDLKQAESGPSAIEACRTYTPDLVLMDYMMPGMTGEEAWDEIRRIPNLGNVPTVFLTAKAQPETAERLLRKGALAVLRKPFDPLTLGPQLREIWENRHGQA